MTIIEAVSRRMSDVMEEKGFTPYLIHKQGGVAKSTISQVLNGTRKNIKITTIQEMASTMGLTLDEFFADPIFKEITD